MEDRYEESTKLEQLSVVETRGDDSSNKAKRKLPRGLLMNGRPHSKLLEQRHLKVNHESPHCTAVAQPISVTLFAVE